MDNGTLFYLLISIVFFVISALTKKKKKPEGGTEEVPSEQGQTRKPVSFEELLKEIRQEQRDRQKDFEVSGQSPQNAPEIEQVPEPTYEKLEKIPQQKSRKPEARYYEGTYQSAHRESKEKLVKLDDQVDIRDDEKLIKEVQQVEAKETGSANRYRKLLKNQRTLKDAVVVSEILNRKYF